MVRHGESRSRDWRYEFKYRLNPIQYNRIRIAILPYMRLDDYSRVASGKKYLVRSLYFDTYNYETFQEKMSGDSDRVKFRIRTYSRSITDDTVVRVELKVRNANAMVKYGSFVSVSDHLFFMRRRHWPETGNPVLDEFERCLHLKSLEPKILIEYLREGFKDRAGSDLRITFDQQVRSAHCSDLFPQGPVFFRAHHPQGIILEIKGYDIPPAWLKRLVREHGLKIVANSKFTQGILAVRQELYHPGGVVVIR